LLTLSALPKSSSDPPHRRLADVCRI